MTDNLLPITKIPSTKVTGARIAIDQAPELVSDIASQLNELQKQGKIHMSVSGGQHTRVLSIAGASADLQTIIQLLSSDPDAPRQLPKENDITTISQGNSVLQLNDQQSLYLLKIGGLDVADLSDKRNDGRVGPPPQLSVGI